MNTGSSAPSSRTRPATCSTVTTVSPSPPSSACACPEIVHECGSAQREVLRIELNGARRQITADDWKPLVDHLRAQRTESGARRFSDRVIARAVGVEPESRASATSRPIMQLTHVSQLHRRRPERTARFVIPTPSGRPRAGCCTSSPSPTAGLTAVELLGDEVLREFGEGTVRRLPGQLRDEGLVEADGKRNGSTVWRAGSVEGTGAAGVDA